MPAEPWRWPWLAILGTYGLALAYVLVCPLPQRERAPLIPAQRDGKPAPAGGREPAGERSV